MKHSSFQWRDVYFQFAKSFDPTVTDPGLPTIRLKRPYGNLTVAETKGLDPRETQGKREYVKAIFKSQKGFMVITTLEGHVAGSVYYLSGTY